jgi:hypothetical protein
MKKLHHRRITSVGAEVEVTYEEIDEEHVRIIEYRRRRPGMTNFRKVPEEAGHITRRDQLLKGAA